MRRVSIPLVAIMALLLAASSSSAAAGQAAAPSVWQASLVPCTPALCGGFAQNTAQLALSSGHVSVRPDGLVIVHITKLTSLSGEPAADKTLEVNVGSFGPGSFTGELVGTITTDSRGNFHGTIDTGGGAPFAFAPNTPFSGQFVFNEPGVRSEFVTGFHAIA
jgi:hypothetical protein